MGKGLVGSFDDVQAKAIHSKAIVLYSLKRELRCAWWRVANGT